MKNLCTHCLYVDCDTLSEVELEALVKKYKFTRQGAICRRTFGTIRLQSSGMAQNPQFHSSLHEKLAAIEGTLLAVLTEVRESVPRKLEGFAKRTDAIEDAIRYVSSAVHGKKVATVRYHFATRLSVQVHEVECPVETIWKYATTTTVTGSAASTSLGTPLWLRILESMNSPQSSISVFFQSRKHVFYRIYSQVLQSLNLKHSIPVEDGHAGNVL